MQVNRRLADGAARTCVALGLVAAVLLLSGCADYLRRKELESVAKGWCETIRASQVIPVYPLTADLKPGDVFLVQTPIASQAQVYRDRGFLPLDDHQTRLDDPGYGSEYFDGYFEDPYKGLKHKFPSKTGKPLAGEHPGEDARAALSEAEAPRAAFPTYTFKVRTGQSGGLALPIKGVPVGLNFLNSQSADGSVTIADARTYGGNESVLLKGLRTWAEQNRLTLSETVRQMPNEPVYLRVVTRVYLTGSVVVSLSRAGAGGVSGSVGNPPEIPKLKDDKGNPITDYQGLLNALNTPPKGVKAMAEAGGAFQFLAASESSVTMSESFDTLLVIGYLGFDVPVFEGGELGAPVPTFQRLQGQVADPKEADRVDERYLQQLKSLEGLASWKKPDQPEVKPQEAIKALRVIIDVSKELDDRAFLTVRTTAENALSADPKGTDPKTVDAARAAVASFRDAAESYFGVDKTERTRTRRFSDTFDRVYAKVTKPGGK